MAEAMIQKEKAEGRWDASAMSGMRQDFGYDLRGLTASGSTQPIQDLSLRRGERLGHAARTQSEPGAAALASTTATPGWSPLTIRQEVTAAFTQHDAAQRALEITRRASGRSPVRTSGSSARPIRWDAPPCWT